MTVTSRLAPDQIPAALAPVLRDRFAMPDDAEILNWRPAPRGFSTETTLFGYATSEGATRHLVLRRPPEIPLFPDYDLLRQVLVMKRLARTSIPVPDVHWLDRDDQVLGSPYYVMDQIAGDAPSDFPSYHAAGLYFEATPEQRTKMWWGCVDLMADVHRLNWRELDLDFLALPAHGTKPLEQVVNYLDSALSWATDDRPPSLERALSWLKDNLYEPHHLALCWGDARLSNVLYDGDFNVAGALDWEIAYIGDHEADLAWLLFLDWASSEYEGIPRLDGTPARSAIIEHYQRRSGLPVTNLTYNEVLAAVLLAVPLLRITQAFGLPADTIGFCTRRIDELLGTT